MSRWSQDGVSGLGWVSGRNVQVGYRVCGWGVLSECVGGGSE